MEFWGLEVKSRQPCPVKPGKRRIVHLSQACVGEVKYKASEFIYLYVTIDGKKLVLGTLTPKKFMQQQFDLVFEKNFELSHSWENGSVNFYGYICDDPFDESDDENIGKKDVKSVNEDDSSEDGFDTDSSEDGFDSDEDEDGEQESSEGEGDEGKAEETPKKVEVSKKRPAESASGTPGPGKKVKLVTPLKTDTKKGSVHVATPYPSKQAGKTPANQSKQQTPKSSKSHSCKSCDRSFNSENALQSHTKAKHSDGK